MSEELVCVPDIGNFHDVPVVEVLVKVGDAVKPEDPLVLIESDKAMMEVPAPAAGVVGELLLKVGDTVSAGTPVLRLMAAGSVSASSSAPDDARAGIGAGVPVAIPAAATGSPASASPTLAAHRTPTQPYASPSVRRLARERGIDLHSVRGSGPFGRIVPDDLEPHTRSMPFDLPPWPDARAADHGAVRSQPLSRVQRLSGPALHRNWVSIPHVTCCDTADVTALEEFRQEINAQGQEPKVSLLVLVIRALVAALREHPALNASLEGEELVLKDYCHIGVAVDTPHGLFVPVIHHCERLGVREIAAELARLAAKAQKGTLQPAEMQGGSFTVSSLGGIGGGHFTPVINAPEVAILGLGKAEWRQVSDDGREWRARLSLPLSLSFDHRAFDGAAAARFNRTLAGYLADLRRALL
jgi:pyruvate dehydrogenase E2 component (dihydrolipoamide acetyltransferase)